MKTTLSILVLITVLIADIAAIDVSYDGQPPHEKKQLDKLLVIMERDGVPPERLDDSAVVWLHDNGYFDGSARFDGDHLVVFAAERCFLDRLLVKADSAFEVHLGIPFTRANFETALETLLDRYREQGYYFARCILAGATRNNRRVVVELTLSRGPTVTIASNVYSGLIRTKPNIVSKYLPTAPGDTLKEPVIRRSEKAASEIEFLDFEPPVLIHPRPGYTETDLEFRFREKKQFSFFGGGGYVPDDPTGLVWNANLTLLNLFGGGKEVAVQSERRERGRNVLSVRYRQPLFLLGVGHLDAGVATRDYRDEFYEFALHLGYAVRVSYALTAGLELGWKRVEPSTDLPGYSRFATAFSIGRCDLDDVWNPSRGVNLDWTITYIYRRYSTDSLAPGPIQEVHNETRNAVVMKLYRPLMGSLVGHLRLSYIGLETSEPLPPVSELIFVGGPGTLRGFRNEQFTAQRTAFGTFEPRFRFRQGYLFAFYDGAYINYPVAAHDGGCHTEELYRYGYGLGIALVDRARSLEISVGWNEEAAFDQPRLSVRLSRDF